MYDYLRVHPDADVKIVALTDDASEVAIPVRKGDDSASLLAAVNQAIEELRADGTLSALSEKYFAATSPARTPRRPPKAKPPRPKPPKPLKPRSRKAPPNRKLGQAQRPSTRRLNE